MGKRSNFERNPRDYYPTPASAVLPLLPHLPPASRFAELCAGDGRLIDHLQAHGHECMTACDIQPMREDIRQADAMSFSERAGYDIIITNPPWDRPILHPMISHFAALAPTWLLFDADWAQTKQAIPFSGICHKIVSIGRVKWIEDSKNTGKDNAAWYLFDASRPATTEFIWRQA